MTSDTADTSNQDSDNSWYTESMEESDYSRSFTVVTEGQQPLEFQPSAPPISVVETVPYYPPPAIHTVHHHLDPPSVVLPPMYIHQQQPTWTPINLIPSQPPPPFPTTRPGYYTGYSTFVPAPISVPSYVQPPPQSVMIDVGYPLTTPCHHQDTPVFYEAPSGGMIGTPQPDYVTTFYSGPYSNDQMVLSESPLYDEQKMSFPYLPDDAIRKVLSLGNEITAYFHANVARFLNTVLQESMDGYVLFARKHLTGQCWVMAFNNDGNRIQVKYNRLLTHHLKVKFPSINSVEMDTPVNPIREAETVVFTFSTEYETTGFRNLLKINQKVQWNHKEVANLQRLKGQINKDHNNGIGIPVPPPTPVYGNPGSSYMENPPGDMGTRDGFHVSSSTFSSTTTRPQYSQSYDASADFVFTSTTFSNALRMNEGAGASSSGSSITNSWGTGSATTTDETPREEQNDAQQQQ